MEDKGKEIYRFRRNNQEDVLFKVYEYQGKEFFDVRVWIRETPVVSPDPIPTKKGIRIAMDSLEDFLEGVTELNKYFYQSSKEKKDETKQA